jgi:uncharacterized protein (DUF488 family)
MPQAVFTIGHSTHPFPEFVRLLALHGVSLIVDVRSVPRSRYNPQFNSDALKEGLPQFRIGYTHARGLGGLRKANRDSVNTGWQDASFRGYADYMQTAAFRKSLDTLLFLASENNLAVMCAEAVPWRCHRCLISDALLAQGVEVRHIMADGSLRPHTMTAFAVFHGRSVIYPGTPLFDQPAPQE